MFTASPLRPECKAFTGRVATAAARRWRVDSSDNVVGAHHQQDVLERDDDRHRPEDQRDDPEDALGRRGDRMRIARVEDRLDR
jgi:hypothetical protein